MARDIDYTILADDPLRVAAGLPFGLQGGYFVNGRGFLGQESDPSILNDNQPPAGQPDVWCHWEPDEDGTAILCEQQCTFYQFIPWLAYLITHFLQPWGYVLNGSVAWQGEDPEDAGIVAVETNIVTIQEYARLLGPKQVYTAAEWL
jgi:hypothetical protein